MEMLTASILIILIFLFFLSQRTKILHANTTDKQLLINEAKIDKVREQLIRNEDKIGEILSKLGKSESKAEIQYNNVSIELFGSEESVKSLYRMLAEMQESINYVHKERNSQREIH